MAENENSFAFTSKERCAALDTEDPTYDGLAAVTAQRQNYNAIRTLDGARPATDATILNGILTLTGYARIVVDTEGQAPADDLLTIPTVSTDEYGASIDLCPDGAIIYLKAKDASRVITVKNSQNEYGIRTYSGSDLALRADAWLELRLQDGSWCADAPMINSVADTANAAAVNTAVVHKTGAETISGAKTFTAAITASGGVVGNVTGNVTATSVTVGGKAVATQEYVATSVTTATSSMLCNVREVITTSGTWTAPVTGWYKVTCIGGGGGGGRGGNTAVSGSTIGSGGGGGSGYIVSSYKYYTANVQKNVVIGSGGTAGVQGGTTTFDTLSASGGSSGSESSGNTNGAPGGVGGSGGRNGENGRMGTNAAVYVTGASGGNGGVGWAEYGTGNGTDGGNITSSYTGTSFGGFAGGGIGCGGGGGASCANALVSTVPLGGRGSDGAVILEYYNPTITA